MSTDPTAEMLNYLSAISRDVGELRTEMGELRQEVEKVNTRLDRIERELRQQGKRLDRIEAMTLNAPTLRICRIAWTRWKRNGLRVSG